ncbi:transglycosylase domain-containing protein [Aestuariicoccus sp. MJ-SS9]|uniref:transglycosylase domain-containing protein n=1 Tax=Aestuariicoccus sp. MJ-SS9 TaxID=3079855 RepID=UPI0029141F1B|nr:transglycosylase domain-containing protein [Aestuariicoccus sp. MJ-SS9]MDU8912608.1 transglycosylase domain-containing protein [Aestuariicoccus sp. MJ-SS9]
MSDSRPRKGRLVADRRYPKKPAPPKAKAKPKRRKTARRTAPKRRGLIGYVTGFFGWIFRLIFRLTAYAATVVALIVAGAVAYSYAGLPEFSAVLDGRAKGSVTLLDRTGEVFARRGDQFGGAVTTDTVSPHLVDAIVATEDKRFYRHLGVSPRGIASAIRINLAEGRGPLSGHGGSTITQQTAKLLCLGVQYDPAEWENEAAYVADCRRGSLRRKMEEAIYALAMEAKYSKDEILSIYLNRAYMGGGAYGAEAAAQRYFSKPAAALNPAEAAMLAGLLTAPSSLAPTANLKRSQDRAATVLRLMNEQGYLSDAETAQYQADPATLSRAAQDNSGGYFADWVIRSLLGQGAEDGATAEDDNRTSFADDILRALEEAERDKVVQTTLDPRIQTIAEDVMEETIAELKEGSKAQAAIVVMSADGAVRAMVGGRDAKAAGGFNRATQAVRQTGSAFKPFIYAAALDVGMSPFDIVVDEPFCMTIPGSGQWCPENYTREYAGRVTLAEALKRSLNIPAVKISERVGRPTVQAVASQFGVESTLIDTPSLALGASEASLLEMTAAYAGFLAEGHRVEPYGIAGDAEAGVRELVVRPETAGQLIWMLEKVVSEGTGRRAALDGWQAAGKTGTSNEQRDAWFVGFTADYVAGVWMGYDDNTPLSGVTGGGLPASMWQKVMTRVHEGLSPRPLPMIQPIQPVRTPEPRQERREPRRNIIDQILTDIFGPPRN